MDRILAAAILLLTFGCAVDGKKDTPPVVPAGPAGPPQLTEISVLWGFKSPECVCIQPSTGAGFVSNMVAAAEGEPDQRFWSEDGTGFISLLKQGGWINDLNWIHETKWVTLHSPKGLCILEGILYVADNQRVLRYDLETQEPAEPILLAGAQKLNDLATDGSYVYASDTGAGTVYQIKGNTSVTIKAPTAVNGITFGMKKMYAVSWTLHEVYELDPAGDGEPIPFGLASHFTNLDGIEVLDDGSFVVSDFDGNQVCHIDAARTTVTKLAEVSTPADIGIDRGRNLLYVPSLHSDKVHVFSMKAP